MTRRRAGLILGFVGAISMLTGCGGGGSQSSTTPTPPPPPAPTLTIVTDAILPGTLSGQPYTTTLTATGGQGAFHWAIAPQSPTAAFPNGLSLEAATGILSGTARFSGTAGFVATVTDSASPPNSASKSFYVTGYLPLSLPATQTFQMTQFLGNTGSALGTSTGVPPLRYTVSAGSLPPGVTIGTTSAHYLTGAPTAVGSFTATVTVQDSFSPPESATTQVAIKVTAPQLEVGGDLFPETMVLQRPFDGMVMVHGGIPPYTFKILSGSLPQGLLLDPNSGRISGTPSAIGTYGASVSVIDAVNTSTGGYLMTKVVPPRGRNDTPATATLLQGPGWYQASISPYADPENGAPYPGDNDYYKMVSLGGAIVHLETLTNSPGLDTVLEVVDANGLRLTSCVPPGDSSGSYVKDCINDDIDATQTNSSLDYKVPGPSNTAYTFYVHVFDWRGAARPDFIYALQTKGSVPPLTINTTSLPPAARSNPYSVNLTASNGAGPITWSLSSGALPPGLTLNVAGSVAGNATTVGAYSFTLQASDAATPPQTATQNYAIAVVERVKIVSSPILPDACLNQPYKFTPQITGGVPPFDWSFVSNSWPALLGFDRSTGGFAEESAAPLGTFTGGIGVGDATGTGDFQSIKITIKQCP